VLTVAPAACVSRSGVPAIGMDVDEPAELTTTISAPPSARSERASRRAAAGDDEAAAGMFSALVSAEYHGAAQETSPAKEASL
jgi:hypothetical protein